MEAYIISGFRTAVGKANKGGFRFTRADDLAAHVIRFMLKQVPNLAAEEIDDVIVGNATPEAEQGLNLGRMVSLMSLPSVKVPGVTVNRYCASGLESIATAVAKIKAGMAEVIIAGGVEVMSGMPFGGWRFAPNPQVAKAHPSWYWGMGLTAEEVAKEYRISREEQDLYSFRSHQRALEAIRAGIFEEQIVPIQVNETYLDEREQPQQRSFMVNKDEGPREDTSLERLAKLPPVFAVNGSVTAGNSSQVSDGAAFVLVVSERMLKKLNVDPIARLVSYAVTGVEPKVMGIGPITAIPDALKKANMKLHEIDLIELNEAFASQTLAVINALKLPEERLNIHGGAIALGHPLGCTGAKLSVQLFHALKKNDKRFGLVTMCVGAGQGAAGVFERL